MHEMNSKSKKVEEICMRFINGRRAARKQERLDSDYDLMAAAREHARDMARNNYVSHKDTHGRQPSERNRKYRYVAENCTKVNGWSQTAGSIAADIVESWMKSDPHRRNLMDSKFDRMGVGIWKRGDAVYAVQLSARAQDQVWHGKNLLTELFS